MPSLFLEMGARKPPLSCSRSAQLRTVPMFPPFSRITDLPRPEYSSAFLLPFLPDPSLPGPTPPPAPVCPQGQPPSSRRCEYASVGTLSESSPRGLPAPISQASPPSTRGSFQRWGPQVGEGWLQTPVSLYCLSIFPFSPKRLRKAPAHCKLWGKYQTLSF